MPTRVVDTPLTNSGGYRSSISDGKSDELLAETDAAVQYVEEHNLGQLAADIMSSCLKDRPKKARAYVLRYLVARLSTADLNSVGLFPNGVEQKARRKTVLRDMSRQQALIAKLEKDIAEEKAIMLVQNELDLKTDDVTKYRRVFELVDEDNSGLVGLQEFRKAMAMCGYNPNQRTLMATFRAVDLDGSGQVDFLEFIRLMRAVDPDQAKKRALEMGIQEGELTKLRDAWVTVDEEGHGTLSLQEIRTLCELLGLPSGKSFTARFKEVAFSDNSGDALGLDGMLPSGNEPRGPSSPKSKVDEDEQLAFEEFLKVVKALDTKEESRAMADAQFTEADRDAAKACFRQRDPQNTHSLSLERSCYACSTLLTMHFVVPQTSVALITQEDMSNLFNHVDSDKSGEHDFTEFIRFCGKIRELVKIREEAEERRRQKEQIEFHLSEEEIANYKAMFSKYDRTGAGELQKEGIGHLLKDLGFKASTLQERETFRQILEEVDKDGSGTVDFAEFLRLIPALNKKMEEDQKKADLEKAQELGFSEKEHQEFQQVFQQFDEDNSGTLEINEVHDLLKALRRNTSFDELKGLFTRVDSDLSGALEYGEFLKLVRELENAL